MQKEGKGNEENHFVVVGKILEPYGLKGELKVEPYLEGSKWKGIKRVFLKRKGGDYVPFKVELIKRHGTDKLLIKFEGFDERGRVEGFAGARVFLPANELPKTERGEYYYFELEGLEVFTEKGKRLGVVSGVVPQKPYHLLEVEGGKLYIPFVKELIKRVEKRKGKIVVSHLLEELID